SLLLRELPADPLFTPRVKIDSLCVRIDAVPLPHHKGRELPTAEAIFSLVHFLRHTVLMFR
ncbi:MAG TPA: hypothetical protein VE591_14180, partial [Candidatus Acidoferrum sp.]|nr:hypothetical protein [Candidatus Acidoferrum sp.]